MSRNTSPSDMRPRLEPLEPRLLLDGSPLADVNGDGKVDGGDLALWQQNYDPTGASGPYLSADGDLTVDGKIDGADLALWQQTYDPLGASGDLTASDVPPTPGLPNLLPEYDSGVSDEDNLTNVTTPTIRIDASVPGNSIFVYNHGSLLGEAVQVSGTTYEYAIVPGQLLEGFNRITVRSLDGLAFSLESPVLQLTLDTIGPRAWYYDIIGTIDVPNYATDMEIVGDIAFVASAQSGLTIYDISNPASPELLGLAGTPKPAEAIAVSANTVYLADGLGGLKIYGVSDPSAPVLLGEFQTAGPAQGVNVQGSVVYVAEESSGIQIIDVSVPSSPELLGSYDIPGGAQDVVVVGPLAYATEWWGGLHIIDVSDPSAPFLVGTTGRLGHSSAVDVVGSMAYVADAVDGFYVIDVIDPTNPSRVFHYSPTSGVLDIAVYGSLAYVAAKTSKVYLMDVSYPSAPKLLMEKETYQRWSVVVQGDIAWFAGDELSALRPREWRPELRLASSSDTGRSSSDRITDDITPNFYVIDGGSYLRIYRDGVQVNGDYETSQVTLPQQPYGTFEFTGRVVDEAGNMSDLSAAISVTFTVFPPRPSRPDLLPDSDSGVSQADNVTNNATPTIRITTSAAGLTVMVFRESNLMGLATAVSEMEYEYTFQPAQLKEGNNIITACTYDGTYSSADSWSLYITLDTQGTFASYLLASRQLRSRTTDVVAMQNTVFVAESEPYYVPDVGKRGIEVFDVSQPANPVLIASVVTAESPLDLELHGSYLYAATGSQGLLIFDVSDATAPIQVGQYAFGTDLAKGLSIVNDLAYVAFYNSGVHILDLSLPATPSLVGQYNPPELLMDVEVNENRAYSVGANWLRVYDVSDPSHPVYLGIKGNYLSRGVFRDIEVEGTTVYAGDEEGLDIYDVSDPSSIRRLGVYDIGYPEFEVELYADHIITGTRPGGMVVLDATEPRNVQVVDNRPGSGWGLQGIAVVNGTAYLAKDSDPGYLEVVPLGKPTISLNPQSDTGQDNTDRITADSTPTIQVVMGSPYVRIYRDGILISGEYERGPVTLPEQPNGAFSYTAVAVDAAGNVSEMSEPLGVTIFHQDGDANLDFRVDGGDLATWQCHYDPDGLNQNTPEMGDFNGDGKIDLADVDTWLANYNPLGIIPAGGGSAAGDDVDLLDPAGGASAPSVLDALALLEIDLLEMSELLTMGI